MLRVLERLLGSAKGVDLIETAEALERVHFAGGNWYTRSTANTRMLPQSPRR
jgi:hypothetical protein